MAGTATYSALLFRQRPNAPVQAAFVAPSSEIDSWARVPTKRTGNIRNFQRAQIDLHVREVSRFFQHSENASPTAVVVGFDPIRANGRVHLIDEKGAELGPNDVEPGIPRLAKFVVSWQPDLDPQSSSEIRAAILGARDELYLYLKEELKEITGLKDQDIDSLQAEFDARALAGAPKISDEVEAGGDSEDAADASEDDLDSGTAETLVDSLSVPIQKVLSGLSPSERQLVIGRLEFLANIQVDVLAQASADALSTLYSEVCDELKPGLLIDGQHRVVGTKDIPNVPFLVCALPHAPWPELAFQFIVTNRTARRVQESLLINIVGNSLSKSQRASIEGRLRDAGIRVGLIEAIMKVNEDEQSPFYGLLAFGIKNEGGFLDAAAMRNKVVLPWYERKFPIREVFDHFTEGKLARDRTDFWKSEGLWFEYFIAFWSAVRERYEGSQVFSLEMQPDGKAPVSRLMAATVLQIFQGTVLENVHQYLLDKQNKEGAPFVQTLKNADALAQLVVSSLKPLTPEFFQGWTITGFDGSKGAKDDLTQAIRLVLEGKMTVAKLKNAKSPHRLFKEAE